MSEVITTETKQLETAFQPRPMTATDQLMSIIANLTAAPQEDAMDRAERMWVMVKESQDRDGELAYSTAKAKALLEMPGAIEANQKNTQTSSTYSDLSAVNTVVNPIAAKHGFSMEFNPEMLSNGEIRIHGKLRHEGGHIVEYNVDLPVDDKGAAGKTNKTAVHGRSSTVSYGQRYLVCLMWNIATGHDKDGQGNQGTALQQQSRPAPVPSGQASKASAGQIKYMEDMARKAGVDLVEVCGGLGWESPDLVPKNKVDTVLAALR